MSTFNNFSAGISELEVAVDQAAKALDSGSHLLLDVREQDEWNKAHIAESVLVPLSELAQRMNEIPTDKPIHVICHSGQRSLYARELLEQAGHQGPKSVAGGIVAWAQSGRPVTR